MLLSAKTQKILKFLQEWSSEKHIYDIEIVHYMAIYEELEEYPYYLEQMWDVNLTNYFKDTFYCFSTEGGTGYFGFWLYQELQGEPPIVLLANSGGTSRILAANLNDLVCKMIYNIGFNAGWKWEKINDVATPEELEEFYDELADDYESNTGEGITVEKARSLMEKDRQLFKERALKFIDLISEEQIKENIKKYPSFINRVQQYQLKNDEVSWLKREIKSEEEFSKLLTSWTKIDNKYYNLLDGTKMWCIPDEDYNEDDDPYGKEKIIAAVKGNYPYYYHSKLFQDWMVKK